MIKENTSYKTRSKLKANVYHFDGMFFHGVIFPERSTQIPPEFNKQFEGYKEKGYPIVWRKDGTVVGKQKGHHAELNEYSN